MNVDTTEAEAELQKGMKLGSTKESREKTKKEDGGFHVGLLAHDKVDEIEEIKNDKNQKDYLDKDETLRAERELENGLNEDANRDISGLTRPLDAPHHHHHHAQKETKKDDDKEQEKD
jgi:hypothetical protein